jgi:hypothetical protein
VSELVVTRWTWYGHDRLDVQAPGGRLSALTTSGNLRYLQA